MKVMHLFLLTLLLLSVTLAQDYDPIANPDAIIESGDARFTVLTPRVIRMEWTADGTFEDHASLAFVNRNLPIPKFKTKSKSGWLTITTKEVELKYKEGSGKFASDNLTITFEVEGKSKTWKPGLKNTGNLFGTRRTLDGFDGEIMQWSGKVPISLQPGILSTDGWVLVDDSERPLFDNSDWAWVFPRDEKELQDLYFFGYGLDYKTAMQDFTAVAGKIALPPKFAFGNWWSRYWEYTDLEYRELVEEYKMHDVPLDVLVVDMDWHLTTHPDWYENGEKKKDQAGESMGWTGFTWNNNYFPDPQNFLNWTEEQDLTVCMNLHPASGIQPHESQYPEMAKAMGIDPSTNQYVPFDIVDKNFATNFMDIVLRPMEKDGVDFWWLDWQQWSTTKIPGANPTFYLNYVFFSDMQRQGNKRPMIFHRYGGLGNHRYQIGFSGDTYINWKSLSYQPYFTSTAANVGFGFWSHDIGGHMRGESTPELYTRWIQFGIFSPIFRTHATKATYSQGIERRIWAYPIDPFYIMRDAFHLRKSLLPYIYTAARRAHDTGISMVRPMYFEHPTNELAYTNKDQYWFGNDMIIAPITQKIEEGKVVVPKSFWLPEGEWVEMMSGTSLKGGKNYTREYALSEIPVFVRAGSIIPAASRDASTGTYTTDPMILSIYPAKRGETKIYDDAGNSDDYLNGSFAMTKVEFTNKRQTMKVSIDPVSGSFEGMKTHRSFIVKLNSTLPPEEVVVNGKTYAFDQKGSAGSWSYDGHDLASIIVTEAFPVDEKISVKVKLPKYEQELLSAKPGQFKKTRTFIKFMAKNGWDKSKYSNDMMVHAAQTGHRITLNPQRAAFELAQFDGNWPQILSMIHRATQEEGGEIYTAYLELLKSAEP